MENRYGDRQNSQSTNMGGTNEDNTMLKVHLLKHSMTIHILSLFQSLSASSSLLKPSSENISAILMGTDVLAAKMSPECSYPAVLDIFKRLLQVPIFSSIKDAPLSFHISNFIHSLK